MSHDLSSIQQQASDPEQSVWLAAHAGTGKTKVLVDRILRLLIKGVKPSSILSITYTKAAAAEMQLRIRREVASWAALSDDALVEEVAKKILKKPSQIETERARGLLILLTESAESLQVMTIHGFCQSLLTRFPIEAGLRAVPEIIDERVAAQLLAEAQQRLWQQMTLQKASPLQAAQREIALSLGDGGIETMLGALVNEAQELFAVWQQPQAMQRYRNALRKGLGLTDAPDVQAQLAAAPLQPQHMPRAIALLEEGLATDKQLAQALRAWLDSGRSEAALRAYIAAYLTQEGAPRKTLCTKRVAEAAPDVEAQLREEQAWAQALHQQMLCTRIAQLSEAVMQLGEALLANYQALKQERGALDFNEVLLRAIALLERRGYCEWVLSRLDWQIQHVLIDEAQDTSPLQWRLLRILVDELFVPELYADSPRTLFVVGDKKQSIYRFQGADPEAFYSSEDAYAQWFAQTGQPFAKLTLDQSYRSSEAVLRMVDAVCALNVVQQAVNETDIAHRVFRNHHFGKVTLWPLIEKQEQQALLPPWEMTQRAALAPEASQQLAEQIAHDMQQRIQSGEALPSDMLVLVRRRTAFMGMLSRALQQRGIPVAGADRLNLSAHLVVQDILVLAEWCLLQRDDLALATVLKSPLCDWSDADLLALVQTRRHGCSLFEALQADAKAASEAAQLEAIAEAAQQQRPFEWLNFILDTCTLQRKFVTQWGEEAGDVIAELKRQALLFESQHTPSLQRFVQWMQQSTESIKRDMEQGQNAVRMMTIHGAKGLQARIVYLPDTVQMPMLRDALLWCAVDGIPVAYAVPHGLKGCHVIYALKAHAREAMLKEYYRLLYVALTRAEDELVLMGFEGGHKPAQECWYKLMEQAMQQMGCAPDENGIRIYQSGSVARQHDISPHAAPDPLPEWVASAAAEAQSEAPMEAVSSPSQLVPYALEEADVQTQGQEKGQAKVRGNVTHALLQVLPATAPDAAILLQVAQQLAPDFADAEDVVREVLAIHAKHGWLFAAHSQPEVALQGYVFYEGERLFLRGQIDRLVLEPDRVVIVDYKSNRDVPHTMPQSYLVQLAAYRALLRPVFPALPIEAALLWTASGALQWADGAILETLCKAAPPQLDSGAS